MSDIDDDFGDMGEFIRKNASLDVCEALQTALDGDLSVTIHGTDKLSPVAKEILQRLQEEAL